MAHDQFYQRAFLRYEFDPKSGEYKCATASCHDEVRKAKSAFIEPQFSGERQEQVNPFRSVSFTIKSPPKKPTYGPNQRRFDALQSVGGSRLDAIVIIEKPDQRFIDHASKWELRNSAICQHGGRYQPVVDESLTVIGHYGEVGGGELIAPDGGVGTVSETLEAGIPVFAVPGDHTALPKGWREVGFSDSTYLVVMSVDGEVVIAQTVATRQIESMSTPVFALIVEEVVGRIALSVVLKGLGYLIGKASKLARMLPGATHGLALKFMDKVKRLRSARPRRRIHGVSDTIEEAARRREEYLVERIAPQHHDVEVYLGDAARGRFKAPKGQFPDIVVVKKDGGHLLGEGKGTGMKTSVDQFEAAGRKITIEGGRVSEQHVAVQKLKEMNIDGELVRSPGHGYGLDAQDYLLNMTGLKPPGGWTRQLANGLPIKVHVMP